MTRPTEETLMAYADGMLDPASRAEVERHLAIDPEARELVAMFRETADLARRAIEDVVPAEPPKQLVDAINAAGSAPSDRTVVPFVARLRAPLRSAVSRYALPLAASLALVVGLGVGWQIASRGSAAEVALGPLAPGSRLAVQLEKRASGSPDSSTVVVTSFRDRLGRPCREFERLSRGAPSVPVEAGVACRQPNGTWLVEGIARLAVESPGGGGYVPSGSAQSDALASLMTMLGAKPAMTAAEEQELLARGWRN